MKEQEVGLGMQEVMDDEPQLTLVEALELQRTRMDMGHRDFAEKVLGMQGQRWWAWRKEGKAPIKVRDYVTIIRAFPELRAKVFRHLKWLAM